VIFQSLFRELVLPLLP